ncbi:hypothetical protein ACFQ4K_18810 [Tistrella bauzanensis]
MAHRADQRPCGAAVWAILDDQIAGTWPLDDADHSRDAVIAKALILPPAPPPRR